MRIYVNWETQEVLGPREVEEKIDEKYEEYTSDTFDFDDYLTENYTVTQIWNMNETQKDEVLENFYSLCRNEAEEWFDSNFCEYDVE